MCALIRINKHFENNKAFSIWLLIVIIYSLHWQFLHLLFCFCFSYISYRLYFIQYIISICSIFFLFCHLNILLHLNSLDPFITSSRCILVFISCCYCNFLSRKYCTKCTLIQLIGFLYFSSVVFSLIQVQSLLIHPPVPLHSILLPHWRNPRKYPDWTTIIVRNGIL